MNHTRRDLLKTTTALTLGSATLGAAGSTSGAAATADPSVFEDRGLWTWIPRQIVENDDERERFFEKADAHGIGTLYPHYDEVDELEDPLVAAPDAAIESFLRRCNEEGIEVHPMIGGGIAGWEASAVYPHAEGVVEWNDAHPPEESFDGIHVDVENGTWQQIRDDLFDRFDDFPEELTFSMAQHPAWVRHTDNEALRTLMEHRNLDYYCTMVYDLNEATFWPNFGRAVQPWDTPYVLGQGGNEHGHPNRNWSDADAMYEWVETNFVTESPPTEYQYVDETIQEKYVGFSLHSYWALIPAPQGETIGSPSRTYLTDPADDGDGGGGGNESPTASVSASATTVVTGETVEFDGSGSADPDGTIESYEWDLTGDDSVDAAGETASRSYDAAGEVTVTLTVTDGDGATDEASVAIAVESEGGNEVPTADASASSTTVPVDEPVTFDASGSSDPDGTIASYEWDLAGDGAVDATGETVDHAYASAGEREVTLAVTDADGASATDAVVVTVESDGDGGQCAEYDAWGGSTAYTGGDRAVHDGSLWEAEWWTQGTEPSASATVWTEVGRCGDDGNDGGDGGDDGDDGGDGADCSDAAAYDASATYNGGDRAVYEGTLWEAEWWTRGTEPSASVSVWTEIGACSNP